jgi:hypothetical protein
MSKIIIVHTMINGKKFNANYCGRPKGGLRNPLQNDFTHIKNKFTKAKYVVDSLAEAIDAFEYDILEKIKNKDSEVLAAFKKLKDELDKNGVIYLSCWCMDEVTPRKSDHACHTQVIRRILNNYEEYFDV